MAICLQFSLGQRAYTFRLRWVFLLLWTVFFLLLVKLGCWQLQRYAEKQQLVTESSTRLTTLPVKFSELKTNPSDPGLQFTQVLVSGRYDNEHLMLLQNRMHDSHVGFDVLTPLELPGSKKLLLVDRGWVSASANGSLPIITPVKAEQHLVGYLKAPEKREFILGKNILQPDVKPLQLQKINFTDIEQATGLSFYPYVLRLSASSDNGFTRDWPIVIVEPARHLAYAVQWFVMALVLIIAVFSFCIERKK